MLDKLYLITYNPAFDSTGFDRDHAAGEAIRMRCVKWQT